MTFITLGFKNNVITDGTFITLGFKCYYMMGPLLHLGPVITLVPSTYVPAVTYDIILCQSRDSPRACEC